MAEPIDFPERNRTWVGPAGGNIGDLPTLTQDDYVLSCWRLSADEIAYVQEHGKVWLQVWGRQPPVSVFAGEPFGQEGE